MSKNIKETPNLYGKDAKRFNNEIKTVSKITNEEKILLNNSYIKLKSISQ